MRIAQLRIENFRGVKRGRVYFGQHSVLVGANNSGKTTIMDALAFLFNRNLWARTMTEHDFYGGQPGPADRIRIIATIIGFAPNDPSEQRHWFVDGRAVEKWYDAETQTLYAEQQDESWQLACDVGFCARFDLPTLEVDAVRYFHDDDASHDPFDDETSQPIPRRLIEDLGFFIVPASRTWDAVISFESELFRRVVSNAEAHPSDSVIAERDRLRNPNGPLEVDKALAGIVGDLNREMAGFFRSEPKLRLRLTHGQSRGL